MRWKQFEKINWAKKLVENGCICRAGLVSSQHRDEHANEVHRRKLEKGRGNTAKVSVENRENNRRALANRRPTQLQQIKADEITFVNVIHLELKPQLLTLQLRPHVYLIRAKIDILAIQKHNMELEHELEYCYLNLPGL